ncbi:MAG: succinate dehydrogenase cytochrome b subunit [Planctomycetota bacterium]|nr:succinate dehydrogenase cytochrome b subunit [Planctomycetota bacterium]
MIKAFSSSIGKKLVMAITGLALCGFLAAHLGGNLLLYVGAEQYNHYAEALHSQKLLLPIAEVGLLLLFVMHLVTAFRTTLENRAARPIGYEMRQSKLPPGPFLKPASSVMYGTGIVVLLFLLLHLSDFKFELRNPAVESETPFAKAQILLRDPLTAIVYIIGSFALGYHVLHGVQSAFQTLGFNHPKYNSGVKTLSTLFALAVALGFSSFPLWAWAFHSK